MALRIKAKLEGGAEVEKRLRALKPGKARAITRKAANAAIGIPMKAAKQAAPVGESRLLRKSIGRKITTYPSGVVVALAGPRSGFARMVVIKRVFFGGNHPYLSRLEGQSRKYNPVFYAHLTEGGTTRLQAKHWLLGAWRRTKAEAQKAFEEKMAEELAKL